MIVNGGGDKRRGVCVFMVERVSQVKGMKVRNVKLFSVIVCGWAVLLVWLVPAVYGEDRPYRDLYADTWSATDALGRVLPEFEDCGGPKANRTVGLFYFLWLGQHSKEGPYDITELLKKDPNHPAWGAAGAFHHWGRPELGYYTSDSAYVIRRHVQLLTAAGVDVLIFDVTNAFTYPDIYLNICEIFTRLGASGQATPQIMFLANSHSNRTIKRLYDDLYSKKLYPQLWFQWEGKPLLLTGANRPDGLPAEIEEFFTFRKCWAWTHGQDTWNWLDHWPQRYGWHESPDRIEQISVSAAQHPVSNIGRSHRNGRQPESNDYGIGIHTGEGLYFEQQWDRALKADPEFIFITGWNEWVAQRFIKEEGQGPDQLAGRPLHPGDSYFVDAYTQEYSRDIEPMEGGYGDNYYYQMAAGIRRYKGVRKPQTVSRPTTILIDGGFDDWRDVAPEFRDFIGDVEHRHEKGWGQAGEYVNTTGRNDFAAMKAARDDTHVYFYARTDGVITPHTDSHWMLLYIDADQDAQTGWEGYDLVVNLEVKDGGKTSVHALQSGWDPKPVASIDYAYRGKELELAVPRALLNCGSGPVRLDFHWTDNVQPGRMDRFALDGDSAPERRFKYRYCVLD